MDKVKLAKHLVALAKALMSSGETFECPDCGTKVLKNTGYCLKCKKKVKSAAEAEKVAMPMEHQDPLNPMAPYIAKILRAKLGVPNNVRPSMKPILMTYEEFGGDGVGHDSCKFHYFAVYPLGGETYVSGNAYGRIGMKYLRTIKAVEIARGGRYFVEGKTAEKFSKKRAKGYDVTRFMPNELR